VKKQLHFSSIVANDGSNNLFLGLSDAVPKQRASGSDDGNMSGNTLTLLDTQFTHFQLVNNEWMND